MALSPEETREFMTEALELLDSAETALLAMDGGEPLLSHYDGIFRVFHSLKGAAGMMALGGLQSHMHQLENILSGWKGRQQLGKEEIDFLLRGVDASRKILSGTPVNFNYSVAPEPAAPRSHVTKTQRKGQGKIIVIDDEPDVVEYLQDILEEAGFEVLSFTDPKVAVARLATPDFDVVVTDIKMPELSGLDVLKAVRASYADVPVIFVSGNVTPELMFESIELGIYAIVEKPFSESHVVQLCLTASKKAQLTRLLNRSINLLLYQFSDLDKVLESQGKDEVRRILKKEIETLLARRQELKQVAKKAS